MAGQAQGGQVQNINTLAAQGVKGAGMGTVSGKGYQPQTLAQTNLSPYMNPYTTDVIKATEADILRGGQLGINELGAQAQAAKALPLWVAVSPPRHSPAIPTRRHRGRTRRSPTPPPSPTRIRSPSPFLLSLVASVPRQKNLRRRFRSSPPSKAVPDGYA